MKKQTTLQNKINRNNPKYHGDVINVAYNPMSRRYEIVNTEDELRGATVIKMYWLDFDQKYITIPE